MRCKAAILLAAALFTLSCNRQKQRRIAVIPKGTSHVFWQSVHAGAEAAGKQFHEEILWDGPPNETDYSRQLEIFDSMLNRHVDGIVAAADDRTILNASLDRAMREKIPVVMFDSGVDSTSYVTFVATNNFQAGEMAARKLGDLLHGRGDVAMIENAPGSASTMDRERGFRTALGADFPGIRIVANQYGMSDRARAMGATENILTSHPDLEGLFASSEPSSVGASQAIKSRGLAGKIRFIGFDSSDGLVEDLHAGVIDALVAQDPFRIGFEGVRALTDKLNGKTPPKQMDLSATVITKEDLKRPEIARLLHPNLTQ